jgi:hypothetical protein
MTTYTPWRTARYPSTCRRCPERIEAGFTVYHIPRSRATLCHKCGKREEASTLAATEDRIQRAAFAHQTTPKED